MAPEKLAENILDYFENTLQSTPSNTASACAIVLVGLATNREQVDGLISELWDKKQQFMETTGD